jgi:hypothetical protein
MSDLAQQRCFNHANREAVARCPECGRFFCRECVTEHEDRVICAACLRRQIHPPLTQRGWFVGMMRGAQLVVAVVLVWLFFHFVGESLLLLPSSFHEGTLWVPTER